MLLSNTDVIDKLQLEQLPLEGGYFRRSYENPYPIDLGKGYQQPLGTGIYFLLTTDSFSALHHLIEDELYHFYLGDPVELVEIDESGTLKKTILGPDLLTGQRVQYPVLRNQWHGSRLLPGGKWALLGTTMSPGFTWEDFKLGSKEDLIKSYPTHKQLITELTRG